MDPNKEHRVVTTRPPSGAEAVHKADMTYLLPGDSMAERFLAFKERGAALPTLLRDGWRIAEVVRVSDDVVHYVLQK